MYLTNKAQVHFSPGIGLAARPIDPYWPMAMARMFLINYMETMAFAMLAYDAYKVGIPSWKWRNIAKFVGEDTRPGKRLQFANWKMGH